MKITPILTVLRKRTLVFLLSILFCSMVKFVSAAHISFWTDTRVSCPGAFTGIGGKLNAFSANVAYYYRLVKTGDFSTTDFTGVIGNIAVAPEEAFVISSSNPSPDFYTNEKIPADVPLARQYTVRIEFYTVGSSQLVCSGTYYIKTPTQSFGGPTALCAGPATYTFTSDNPVNYEIKWLVDKPGWKINGLTPPVLTTSRSVTVTPPSTISDATITVSSDFLYAAMCKSYSIKVYSSPGVPAKPGAISFIQIIPNDPCFYKAVIPAIAGAVTYEWSTNNFSSIAAITTAPEWDRTCCGDFIAGRKYSVYVRAKNGCGTSPVTSITYTIPNNPGPGACQQKKADDDYTDDPSTEYISIFPNPASAAFEVTIPSQGTAHLKLMTLQGHVVRQVSVLRDKTTVDVSDLPAGMYLMHINVDGKMINKRIEVIK